MIATKTISAEVYVFDYSKHPSKPAAGASGRQGAGDSAGDPVGLPGWPRAQPCPPVPKRYQLEHTRMLWLRFASRPPAALPQPLPTARNAYPPAACPPADGLCKPDIRLTGHKNEGYGLSWSAQREGYLLSGSDDAQICVWDVKGTTQSNRVGGGWGGVGGCGSGGPAALARCWGWGLAGQGAWAGWVALAGSCRR